MIINKKERITSQKKVILDYLRSVKIHPDAEKVYLEVKKKLPRISRGTVYRILNNSADNHVIQKVSAGVSHFDGDVSPHAHFICKKCDQIFDIFYKPEDFLKRKKIKVGRIENYQVYFYGTCKKCSKKSLSRLPGRNKNKS